MVLCLTTDSTYTTTDNTVFTTDVACFVSNRAGADGCVETAEWLPSGECCPPRLGDISYCAMACSFIGLLPSGPMWDRPKAEAMAFYQEQQAAGICGPAQCAPKPGPENSCYSLVRFSVYLSNILMDMLLNSLWPALREADPFLAVTTVDEWLDRLGWEDCYRTACRSAGGALSPYEIDAPCGPLYCPVAIPADLECAIKRALVHALSRAQMGGIRNLCWINWVLEPLAAKVSIENSGEECNQIIIVLSSISDTLPKCPADLCPAAINLPQGRVPAKVQPKYSPDSCDFPLGLPFEISPALYSAECIVRSLLPNNLAKNIRRDC